MTRPIRRCYVFAAVVLSLMGPGARAAQPPPVPGGLGARNIPIEFTLENGWVYDGRIELPVKDKGNGYAVMILGGGRGTPIDWMIPGEMTIDGKGVAGAGTMEKDTP